MPSFLLGWIALEKYIDEMWVSALTEYSIGGKRRKKLLGIFWTSDDKVETLNLVGKIKNKRYKKIMKFKKNRNDILHEGKIPNELHSLVTEELDLIREIIKELSGI